MGGGGGTGLVGGVCVDRVYIIIVGWVMQRGQRQCWFLDLERHRFSKIAIFECLFR